MQKVNDNNGAWIYCFKRENSAVFLNRKDEVIKEFSNYDEAIEFAKNNMELIDKDFANVESQNVKPN